MRAGAWLGIVLVAAAIFIGADSAFGGTLSGSNAPNPANGGIDALMQAIATAEGSLEAHPTWNNPGDLTKSFGFANSGPQNSDGVLAFNSLEDGWGALRKQLELIASGGSGVYSTGDSILDMGYKWAGSSQGTAWASNVAAALGVDPSSSIGDFLNG